MNVLIRADASAVIGTGHIMRCLALAEQMHDKGWKVHFVCKELPGHMLAVIRRNGFEVSGIPLDVSCADTYVDAELTKQVIRANGPFQWVIVDHYGLDEVWQRQIKSSVDHVMVIDDLANRRHHCDMLLDQNYNPKGAARYKGLIPEGCRRLIGPSYLLLRSSFYEMRDLMDLNRDRTVRRILLFFGGSDPTGETMKAIEAVHMIDRSSLRFDVVVGDSNPMRDQIESACRALPNIRFHCQVNEMASMMALADFSVGAGGVAMWERCFLGLPSAVVITADNQAESVEAAASREAIWPIGMHTHVKSFDIADIILRAVESPHLLEQMSRNGLELVDSRPGTKYNKAIDVMMEVSGNG